MPPHHESIVKCIQTFWTLCRGHLWLGSKPRRVEGSPRLSVTPGFIDNPFRFVNCCGLSDPWGNLILFSRERQLKCVDRAQLSTFLQESRDGIDAVVGENGVQLSGGQRQRLGIARALYSRPKLLVLGEATSALDAAAERIITETLDSPAGDVTLIVIAHRLATVRHCDQVIHLSAGRITGRGTFEQVRAQVPEFNRQAELLGL